MKKKKVTKYLKFTGVTIILLLIFIAGNMTYQKMRTSDYFVIKNVRLDGVYHSNQKKVDKVAKGFVGMNLFDVDLKKPVWIDDQWVEKVNISRQFPDKLLISIYEKKSAFVYRRKGRCYYYISTGVRIKTSCKNYNVDVIGAVDLGYLDAYASILSSNRTLNDSKVKMYRSYFSLNKDGYSIKYSYDKDIFAQNKHYFESGIKDRYSKIANVDLRVDGKIYVSGVLNEAG